MNRPPDLSYSWSPLPVPSPGQTAEEYCLTAILAWMQAGTRREEVEDRRLEIAAEDFARQMRRLILKEPL